MSEDDSQLQQERNKFDLEIKALKDTITYMEYDRFNMEVANKQKIGELEQDNIVLQSSLRTAEDKIFLLQERLASKSGVPVHNPSVPDFGAAAQAVLLDEHPLPQVVGQLVTGASALDQVAADTGRGEAATETDEVLIEDGRLAYRHCFNAGASDLDSSDQSDSSTTNSHVPAAWHTFKVTVDRLRLRLLTDPDFALRYKHPGPMLQDLVKYSGQNSGKYFASKEVIKTALETSNSYFLYAVKLFDDVFDHDVSLHCKFNGLMDEDVFDVDLMAFLPEVAVSVFLAHCFTVAQNYYHQASTEFVVEKDLTRWINEHLNDRRALYKVGPTVDQYSQYRYVMNTH